MYSLRNMKNAYIQHEVWLAVSISWENCQQRIQR